MVMRVTVSNSEPCDEAQRAYRVYEDETYYSRKDFQNQLFYLETDEVLEKGHSYLIHGYCCKSGWAALYIMTPIPFENPTALAAGLDSDVSQMLVDVTGREESCLTDHPDFALLADYYRAAADSLLVTATADLENLCPVHEHIHNLSEGTGFRAGDGKVLVLSRELAKAQGLAVGDPVRLKLAAQSGCGFYDSYWPETGFGHEDTYTIVGLFEGPLEARLRVYIPSDAAPQVMDQAQNGPVLGQARVPNDRAEEFYLEMAEKLPPGVQLTLYDQGYAAAAAPFADTLRAARLILLACAAVGLAILALFGYLFVYRQRDVMENMHRLGVPRERRPCTSCPARAVWHSSRPWAVWDWSRSCPAGSRTWYGRCCPNTRSWTPDTASPPSASERESNLRRLWQCGALS